MEFFTLNYAITFLPLIRSLQVRKKMPKVANDHIQQFLCNEHLELFFQNYYWSVIYIEAIFRLKNVTWNAHPYHCLRRVQYFFVDFIWITTKISLYDGVYFCYLPTFINDTEAFFTSISANISWKSHFAAFQKTLGVNLIWFPDKMVGETDAKEKHLLLFVPWQISGIKSKYTWS